MKQLLDKLESMRIACRKNGLQLDEKQKAFIDPMNLKQYVAWRDHRQVPKKLVKQYNELRDVQYQAAVLQGRCEAIMEILSYIDNVGPKDDNVIDFNQYRRKVA